MEFCAQRLSIARKRRLLNQKGFARRVGVSAHTISRCENGLTVPTEENVRQFAKILGFPTPFFYGPEIDELEQNLVSFRSQTSMTSATRDAALAAGAIGFLISDWVEERFDLPPVALPDLHLYGPEAAASVIRNEWGLGQKPISNIIHLLESKGVRIFSLAENSKKVNAFSLWRDDKPYIFLNTMKSAESSRFDAAHELAHLVLHQDGQTTGRLAEDQAHSFASAFLMPREDVLATLPRVLSVQQIVQFKKRWMVSVAALNYRLHKLEITSDWKYRDFCIRLSELGYAKNEPEEMQRERSVVWQKVLKTLWGEKTTQIDIARDLHLPVSEVNTLIFGILHSGSNDKPNDPAPLALITSERIA